MHRIFLHFGVATYRKECFPLRALRRRGIYYLMKSLKSLLSALAYLALAALVIGSLAYCFAQLLIGGSR